DVYQATHEGAWGEDRRTNDVIEAVPDAGQGRARAEVHEAVAARAPDERCQYELMVEEDLVGPGDGQASETRDRRTRGRSGLRNEKGGLDEGLILVDVRALRAPQPVGVAEVPEATQLRQGDAIGLGPEVWPNGWPAGLPGSNQHPPVKDV